MNNNESYLKEKYEQLKNCVKCEDLNAISKLLNKNNSNEFQEYIINMNGTSLDLFENKKVSESIINKIMSLFNKNLQLDFIRSIKLENVHTTTLQLVNNKQELLDDMFMQYYINDKMHNGEFEDIIKTNELFNTNILLYKSNYFAYYIHLMKEEVHVGSYLDSKEYQGVYDIIYDYTPKKEQFLVSQNIELPSLECAQSITSYLVEQIQKNQLFAHPEYFHKGLQHYTSRMMYAKLQESLPNNNKPKSYTKI